MPQTSVNRMLQDAVQESINGMLPKLIKTISESITASISEQFRQFEQKLDTIRLPYAFKMRQDYLSTSYLDQKYLPSERSETREI